MPFEHESGLACPEIAEPLADMPHCWTCVGDNAIRHLRADEPVFAILVFSNSFFKLGNQPFRATFQRDQFP